MRVPMAARESQYPRSLTFSRALRRASFVSGESCSGVRLGRGVGAGVGRGRVFRGYL